MIFYVETKRKKGEHSLIVDSIIKSLVEKHPDLLNSFEGGNWEDFLNGVYPDDVEIIVLRNIVEYAHFNEYLPEEVVLLKKENFYTLGEKFLDGEQGYEVPLLEGEEKVADKTVIPKRSKSSKNKKKKRNKLYYLLYFLIFLSVVILGIFLVLNGSTAQEVSQKDVPKLPTKTEKKVENQNKGSESKKEESEKKSETTSSEPKKEESESNPKPANSQSRNSTSSSNGRNSLSSNQEVGSTSTPAQPSNNAPAPSSTEKPSEAPTKEEVTTEKPSVEEKPSEEPKETPKEEKKEEVKEVPASSSDENKTEDDKKSTSEKDKKE